MQRGEKDLDLLVLDTEIGRLAAVLEGLRFKRAVPPARDRIPGATDYYGYDEAADVFVHVHAYDRLVLGSPVAGLLHLPLEQALLDGSTPGAMFPVPSPECEWVVFVVHMVFRFGGWELVLGQRSGSPLPARRERERVSLRGRTDPTRIRQFLEEHLPALPLDLFECAAASLEPGCPTWERIRAGWRLRRALVSYAPPGSRASGWVRPARRAARAVRRRLSSRVPRKKLAGRGALIDVIEGPAAARRLLLEELHRWLEAEFETAWVTLRRPPLSWTSRILGLVLARARTRRNPGAGGFPARRGMAGLSRPRLWKLCRARDRKRAWRKAQRFAAEGVLVLCEGLPQAAHQSMTSEPLRPARVLVPMGERPEGGRGSTAKSFVWNRL